MSLEMVDDIIEQLANSVGVYGAHDEDLDAADNCRVCWTSDLRDRLDAAYELEAQLKRGLR